MSARELDRLEIIGRVAERRLTQRQAAEQLGLSERQVQRLCHGYRESGPAGLVSRQRGRPSNRRLSEALRERALELMRSRYADFGPTLACEKLSDHHGFRVSIETLRRWMFDEGLWVPCAQRSRRVHQPRQSAAGAHGCFEVPIQECCREPDAECERGGRRSGPCPCR